MSLRVWLPLNGTLDNQGLDDVVVTNNGATVDNNGKIGKCYSFDGSDDGIRIDGDIIPQLQQNNFSICFWLFSNDAGDRSIYIATTPASDWGFSIEKTTANKLRVYWQGNPDFNSSLDIPDQQWCHIAVVIKDGNCYCYKNGEKLAERTSGDMTPAKLSRTWIYAQLGRDTRTGTTVLKGKMNDFRWYDHALSSLEVKQISQGLILHYPLNNVIGGLPRLWSLASYTRSIDLTTSYAYIYSIPNNTVWLTPGKQYTVAAEVKVNQNNILFYFDSNCTDANGVYSGNDAAQTVQYNPVVNLEKDKWVPVYITTTIKNDAGKPYYHHGFLFRTNSGTLTTNCEIRNIEVYEGNLKLCRGLLPTDNIEYDCSGFENNGTRTGTFSWTSNTPKYAVSQVFNGTDNAIQTPSLPSMISDKNYTIAVWIYKTVIGSKSYQTIYGGPSGFEIEARNGGANETKFVPWNWGKPMASYELNKWNHCVFVHSDSDCKIYLNGEYIATGSAKAANPSGNYFVGAWNTATQQNFDGLMSDFRIYATALSAKDVKSLYNNSAYIDNEGNIYGAVYEEV